jgi:hypothetical protein
MSSPRRLAKYALFGCVLTISCTHAITMNQIAGIDRALPLIDFHSSIGQSPKRTIDLAVGNRDLHVEIYSMVTGTRTTVSYGPYGPIYGQADTTDEYFFVFEDSALFTWGFLAELQGAEDASVREIAIAIQREIDNRKKGARP